MGGPDLPSLPRPGLVVALGLGSNAAPGTGADFHDRPAADGRVRALEGAVALVERCGFALLATSPLFATRPVGVAGVHPEFLNACALVATARDPFGVLDATEAIERKAGRTSKGDLRPRPLDLDLLAAWTVSGDSPLRIEPLAPLATPRLTLPHPRLATRRFALVPLADVAPDWPVALDLGKPPSTPRTLLAALERAGPRDSTDVAGGPASPRFPFRAPVMACFAASPATPRGRA